MNALDSIFAVNPASARAAGYDAIGRYLPVPGAENGLTGAELESYALADFPCFVVAELDPSAPSDMGAVGGSEYGGWAVLVAKQLDIPRGAVLYTSNDAVVTNWNDLGAFFEAYAQQVAPSGYKPGLYGQSSVWELVHPLGIESFWHAPDGTEPPWPAGTNIAQNPPSGQVTIDGLTYDTDAILTPASFGAFTLDGLWPAPTGGPDVQVPVLGPGDHGPAVRSLIGALIANGFAQPPLKIPPLTQEAIYDADVESNVRAFRTFHHIEPGGEFGPDCWAALIGVPS